MGPPAAVSLCAVEQSRAAQPPLRLSQCSCLPDPCAPRSGALPPGADVTDFSLTNMLTADRSGTLQAPLKQRAVRQPRDEVRQPRDDCCV